MKLQQNSNAIRNISSLASIVILVGFIAAYLHIKYKESPAERFYDEKAKYHGDSVTSSGSECAPIGMDILKNHNGTAVDAMIATLFCEGVIMAHSTGLGGGFVGTIYEKATGKVETIVARERAPLASTPFMFTNITSVNGILSVAVPGALKGYAEMHKKYGRAPWKTLIQPTINICRSDHEVTQFLGRTLQTYEKYILVSPSLREVFVNPKTGRVWKVGDRFKRTKFAETLEIIAEEGADSMYTENGTIAKRLIQEFKDLGGIITMEDLTSYNVTWQKPISTNLRGNLTLNTVPLPASGMILSLILNILNGYEPSMSVPYLHKMVESFKYAYAKRSFLGDENFNETFLNQFTDMKYADHIRELISKDENRTFNDFRHYGTKYEVKEDHGTSHVSVLSKNGDAVAITGTLNSGYGSKIRSRTTGIILNNQMDDFSTPGIPNQYGVEPSPANFIKPGKRPLSSMCPSIVIDKNGDAVYIAGITGGSRITTNMVYVFVRHVWMNETLKDAVLAKRIHHQLLPMETLYEEGFDESLVDGLKHLGHTVVERKKILTFMTGISRVYGHIEAVFDPRRSGSVEIN